MSPPTGDPPALPQALGRLRIALETAYLRAATEQGLTAAQAELLCAAMRPAAVSDIAAQLRCDRSNVTRLADRAERQGLIERGPDPRDRRVTEIRLSAAGRERAAAFLAALEAQTAALRNSWPDRHQTQAVSMLNDLAAALEGAPPALLRNS